MMKEKIIELLKAKDLSGLKALLAEFNVADVSEIIDELDKEDAIIVFRLLNKDEAAEVFSRMEQDTRERLIEALTEDEIKEVVDKLFLDDAADLVEEMPANLVKKVLANTKPDKRSAINELLKYPEDSAGSIMTTEFIDLKENLTVKEAFERIRAIGKDKETIYTLYVTDMARCLIGIVTVKELVLADLDAHIKDIMEENVIKLNTLEDKEDVVKMFDKYDFLAMPVVDSEDRLVGIITVDDAMDVMQDEASEDFEIMAAVTPSDESYFDMSVVEHTKHRIVWLLVLMLSATITGSIITHYEEAFASIPILVSFIPMLMDTGGNCGSQSSTLIIRGLATGEIYPKDVFKVWFKEIRVAILVGIILAVVNGVRVAIQYGDVLLALVIGITLVLTVLISKSLGCILPLAAKKLKLDPAIMASPLITTIVDTCSILIYFNVAVALFHI